MTTDHLTEIHERLFHRLVVDQLNERPLDAVAVKRYSELTGIATRFVFDDVREAADAFLDGAIPARYVNVGDRVTFADDAATTMTVEVIGDPGIGTRRFSGPTTDGGYAAISVPVDAPAILIARG